MTDYLHHVPGRLRVRSRALRCDSAARGTALRKLRTLDGVRSVRLNAKAASVTVCYDTELTKPQKVLAFINAHCLATTAHRESEPAVVRQSRHRADLSTQIGKMALSVLVNKGVSYSISSLLGARA